MEGLEYCPYCVRPHVGIGVCQHCGRRPDDCVPSAHHLRPGTVLKDRYWIGHSLGEGGFGIVYIGRDLAAGRPVTVKEYFPRGVATRVGARTHEVSYLRGVTDAEYRQGLRRFLDKAHRLALLASDERFVGISDCFEWNNTAYVVMEHVEGRTLLDVARDEGGRIGCDELLARAEPVFGALGAMHAAGLIHRDVTPDNILIAGRNTYIIDLGSAIECSADGSVPTVSIKDGYAPIEQYTHQGQGPWTDVYGLAATLYRCLTGIRPPSALDRQATDELVRPRLLGVAITEEREDALMRGLCLRPSRRFQTMGEFHEALYGVHHVR